MKPKLLLFAPFFLLAILPMHEPPMASAEGARWNPSQASQTAEAPIPESWLAGSVRMPDPSMLISPSFLIAENSPDRAPVLVDVRDQADFDRCRIPSSLRIPLHAIRTKEFLTTKHVVLVGGAVLDEREEAECARLRSEGFLAFVLDGGIPAWVSAGGPLVGEGCLNGRHETISASELFASRHDGRWLFVNACRTMQNDARRLIPQALPLPDPENLHQLEAFVGRYPKERPITLMVFDDDGTDIPLLARRLEKSSLPRALFLDGGIIQYRGFLARQATTLEAHRSSTRKAFAPCTDCP